MLFATHNQSTSLSCLPGLSIICAIFFLMAALIGTAAAQDKPFAQLTKIMNNKPIISKSFSHTRLRVVISTDFPPLDVIPGGVGQGPANKRSDPDDVQSMVRFLLYANEFDVEGLIASAGTFANIAVKQNILDILSLYGHVDENLRKHDQRYPTADHLRSITWQGLSGSYGKPAADIIGPGKDSEASDNIIALLDQADPRPIWFCVWGGSRELAQALWKIKNTRSTSDIERIIPKVRVYLIGLQDGSGQWLLDTFPKLFVILSRGNYMGMFNNSPGSNAKLSDLTWINTHVRNNHGALGAVYPQSGFYPETPGVWEGDTPSFLYLVSSVYGLNDSEMPDQPSWGGQFVRANPVKNIWTDAPSGARNVWRWREPCQNDFAVRMDWCVKDFKNANHPPVIMLSGVFKRNVKVGETVKLTAMATDPDGDKLSCKWKQYTEADTATAPVTIANSDSLDNAWFVVPDEPGKQIFIVIEVTDNGAPALTRYQHVMFTVKPRPPVIEKKK